MFDITHHPQTHEAHSTASWLHHDVLSERSAWQIRFTVRIRIQTWIIGINDWNVDLVCILFLFVCFYIFDIYDFDCDWNFTCGLTSDVTVQYTRDLRVGETRAIILPVLEDLNAPYGRLQGSDITGSTLRRVVLMDRNDKI